MSTLACNAAHIDCIGRDYSSSMDGQRIDKILVVPPRTPAQEQTGAALQ
jgi:hypothetical protein